MSLSRLVARPLIAAGIIYLAQGPLRHPQPLTPKAAKVTDTVVPQIKKAGLPLPEDTATLVRINAATQIVAALAMGTGRAPRLGATVLSGSLAATTVAGHAFWDEKDPDARKVQTMEFFKNLVMLGGLIIAAGDTDGSPGLAWRAKRAAKDARREARTATKLTKAKLS